MNRIDKKLVTDPNGVLWVEVYINNRIYCTLKSDIIPETKADINYFISAVIGEATVTRLEDYEKLGTTVN